jgi:hypothetical protein
LIPQSAAVVGADPWGINNRGEVVIGGFYNTSAPFGNGKVYLSDGATTTLVAAVGDPAPGGRELQLHYRSRRRRGKPRREQPG